MISRFAYISWFVVNASEGTQMKQLNAIEGTEVMYNKATFYPEMCIMLL